MEEAKRYKTEAAQRDAFVKICHDMRTPLSSVMHLAQILEIEADSPDRVRERAAEIAVSAEYLLGLADDIVDIYKLGGGRIDIKKEPFSPYELAEDIQKMLCPQIKDAGHELAVCIAEAAPDMQRIVVKPSANKPCTISEMRRSLRITERQPTAPTIGIA